MQNISMVLRDVTNKRPETEFVIIACAADRTDDLSKCFQRFLRKVVVTECDVEAHVAGGGGLALRAGTNGAELGRAAVETQGPGHLNTRQLPLPVCEGLSVRLS